MSPQDFVDDLLALPDTAAQKQFLKEHTSLLDDEIADALKAQADYFLRADIDRSLEIADLLLHMAELTGNAFHRALGLFAKANSFSVGGLGEYDKAVELYNEAASIYRAHDHPVGEARAQIGKIFALANLGRYAEAIETGKWASRVFEEHGEQLLLAIITMNLGSIHIRLREDADALAMYDRARDIFFSLGSAESQRHLAMIEQNRSVCLRNLGQFDASIQTSQRALELLVRSEQWAGAARARQNLAVTYFMLGRYNEALEFLYQAREFFQTDGRDRDAILAELFISDCLLQLRRFHDVLDKGQQIREQFTELGTRLEVAQAILNEAMAYTGLERYGEALTSLAEARRLFEAEGNNVLVASTDLETAVVLHYQGDFEASLELARRCIDLFKNHDLSVEEARALLVSARAAAVSNQHDLARRLVGRALAVGKDKDIASLTYQCQHLLGKLDRVRGASQEALSNYDLAIEELERLRGRLMVEFRADFMADKQVIYEDMVDLCLDLDQPQRGLDYAERSKSRALLDMLAYRLDLNIQARHPEDQPLVEELVSLRSERDRLYRHLEGAEEYKVRGWTSPNSGRQQVQQDVLALEKQITDLWHKLLIRNADYARDAALWQVRTEPVQPYLSSETMLLEYFIVHGELTAFLVTAEGVQARRLSADLARVQHLLQLLWLNLRTVPGSAPSRVSKLAINARGLLRQLHELLIDPLKDALTGYPQLVVVPHGPLHYLPFHALHDGQCFLLERHTISYLPGASLLRYCKETRPAASEALILGHSCDGVLPNAVQEAQVIASLLNCQTVLEDDATTVRLKEMAGDCRILHLATHGDFRPDNPLFSGLALADGWLTTLDIFNLRLKASLATLSACQTGRSVVGGGDELLGLMRALLYAGVASLVLSLWMVEDRSTARLMELFYGKLVEGMPKGESLRHAQLQFIQKADLDGSGNGTYAHPYFWAPFFLVGDAGGL